VRTGAQPVAANRRPCR